jgi:hypothetical protein
VVRTEKRGTKETRESSWSLVPPHGAGAEGAPAPWLKPAVHVEKESTDAGASRKSDRDLQSTRKWRFEATSGRVSRMTGHFSIPGGTSCAVGQAASVRTYA